jgi:hypothetical protein
MKKALKILAGIIIGGFVLWIGLTYIVTTISYYSSCMPEIAKRIDDAVKNNDPQACDNLIENLETDGCYKQDPRNLGATYEFCTEQKGFKAVCYSDDVVAKCHRAVGK